MPADNQPSPGVLFANDIINQANTKLEEGLSVEEAASALRHAAANFSAFAFFRSEELPKDPNDTVEDFIKFLEYYLDVHKPKEVESTGLSQLIETAKNEL